MMYSFTRMMRYHVRSQLAAAAFLLASAAVVFGQSAPPTLPDHTVYGRLGTGTGSGPGQAIPFATLSNQLFPAIIRSGRVTQTSTINFYVNGNSGSTATCGPAGASTCAAGSDAATCLTPATSCLTLQNVINLIAASIDTGLQGVNVYLAHNTGTTNYAALCAAGSWLGTSVISILGDSTSRDATVIMDPPSGGGASVKDLCTIAYSHVKFIDNTANNSAGHIAVGGTGNAGHLDLLDVNLGAMTIGTQITVGNLGSLTVTGSLTISGGAPVGLAVTNGGFLDTGGQTVTVSGTPAYSTAFAFMIGGGVIAATNTTFSGSATGPRCIVDQPIALGGFNPNAVFPGNSDCVANEYVGAIGLQTGAGGSSSFAYGTAGHPLLSGGGASAKDTWDSAGVSCTLTTVSHLTVVNGIVTLCN